MASLLDSKLGFGLACALGATAAVLGVLHLRGGDPAAAPSARIASWDGPAGPGTLPAAPAGGGDALAPAEPPLTDAGGRLVIDTALRRRFDSFLKGGAAGEQALHAWLQRRLGPPALAQAEGLAGDYLRYLRAEAALRANQRFVRPDPAGLSPAQLEQMLAWQQQRAQLRERMLGTAVAQAWFGAEDADCRTALDDWRLARTPAGSEEVGSNELRARRLHGAVLEQGRNQRAQACAAQLMDQPAADGPAA